MEILHYVSVKLRRIIGAALVACCALGAAVSTPANALSSKASVGHAVGAKKQVLTATPVSALKSGSVITVSGSGFDPKIGIYVALCVYKGKNKMPTPCGGGVNTSGKNPASVWVSSPNHFTPGLAVPFRKGGKFVAKITVGPMIGSIDCRKVKCVVGTQGDFLNQATRKADVVIPVVFKK